MGALFGFLVTKLLTDNLLRFIATKALLVTLFVVVLPIILNNFVYELLSLAMSAVNDFSTYGDLPPLVAQFTGLAGWFLQVLRIPDAFSVVISALSVRVFLDHIPFLRL